MSSIQEAFAHLLFEQVSKIIFAQMDKVRDQLKGNFLLIILLDILRSFNDAVSVAVINLNHMLKQFVISPINQALL